uniref:SHOCT domain-containing protein n=1 Tax=mine drainage metagenome TaxID=410659 RepID=E6QS86_9ZZZZ
MWPYMMGGYTGWSGNGFMMLLWGLFCLLLLAGIFAGIVLLVRIAFPGREGNSDKKTTALDTLHERYARGEIGRDEYLEKRQDLGQGN